MRNLSWYIARHYLGAGRRRGLLSLITWIALGGVTVGVTALIVVIAVMTGMQKDLRAKILESTPHIMSCRRAARCAWATGRPCWTPRSPCPAWWAPPPSCSRRWP